MMTAHPAAIMTAHRVVILIAHRAVILTAPHAATMIALHVVISSKGRDSGMIDAAPPPTATTTIDMGHLPVIVTSAANRRVGKIRIKQLSPKLRCNDPLRRIVAS
jgi:hypothetical protein